MQTSQDAYAWDAFSEEQPEATIVFLPSLVDDKTGEARPVDIKDEKERWDAR
jgi:hypothetical protein